MERQLYCIFVMNYVLLAAQSSSGDSQLRDDADSIFPAAKLTLLIGDNAVFEVRISS